MPNTIQTQPAGTDGDDDARLVTTVKQAGVTEPVNPAGREDPTDVQGKPEPPEEVQDNAGEAVAESAAPAAAAPSPAPDPDDDLVPVQKQPYEWDKCTITVGLQLLPDDGSPQGRLVVVGARTHLDAPVIKMARLADLAPLPPPLATLLDELRTDLPRREQAFKETQAKERAEKEARTARIAAARKPAKRSKKPDLAAAPSSAAKKPAAPAPAQPAAPAPPAAAGSEDEQPAQMDFLFD